MGVGAKIIDVKNEQVDIGAVGCTRLQNMGPERNARVRRLTPGGGTRLREGLLGDGRGSRRGRPVARNALAAVQRTGDQGRLETPTGQPGSSVRPRAHGTHSRMSWRCAHEKHTGTKKGAGVERVHLVCVLLAHAHEHTYWLFDLRNKVLRFPRHRHGLRPLVALAVDDIDKGNPPTLAGCRGRGTGAAVDPIHRSWSRRSSQASDHRLVPRCPSRSGKEGGRRQRGKGCVDISEFREGLVPRSCGTYYTKADRREQVEEGKLWGTCQRQSATFRT